MAIDFTGLEKLNEGKTKIIYVNPDDSKTVYMLFKDDITVGDGVKHDIIAGKAVADWEVNRDTFELLNRAGVKTHYIASPEEKVVHVKKLERKINLEVVTRRVATGSILKWGDVEEGTRYNPVVTQFHYKDDPLHDPMLDDKYVDYIIRAKEGSEYGAMRDLNAEAFEILEKAFAQFGFQLIDIKLEYGIVDGEVNVIDEISGGSFRLWPYAVPEPDFNKPNVLDQLEPGGRLDKDNYRMGGGLDEVLTKFQAISKITAGFKGLSL